MKNYEEFMLENKLLKGILDTSILKNIKLEDNSISFEISIIEINVSKFEKILRKIFLDDNYCVNIMAGGNYVLIKLSQRHFDVPCTKDYLVIEYLIDSKNKNSQLFNLLISKTEYIKTDNFYIYNIENWILEDNGSIICYISSYLKENIENDLRSVFNVPNNFIFKKTENYVKFNNFVSLK